MIRGVHHVALRARDVAAVARFYVRVLGLRRTSTKRDARGVRAIWLAAGNVIVMVERRERGEPSLPPRSLEATLFSIAPEGHSLLRARLARSGVALESATTFSLYFRDPEGRRIGASSYPLPAPGVLAVEPSRGPRVPKVARLAGRRGA